MGWSWDVTQSMGTGLGSELTKLIGTSLWRLQNQQGLDVEGYTIYKEWSWEQGT